MKIYIIYFISWGAIEIYFVSVILLEAMKIYVVSFILLESNKNLYYFIYFFEGIKKV